MSDLKITKGNTFRTVLQVRAYRYDGREIKDFDLADCLDIRVKCRINGVIREIKNYRILGKDEQDGNNIEIIWEGSTNKVGAYSIEITGRYKNSDWRYYNSKPIFSIVETTKDQNIPEGALLKSGTYYITGQKIYILPVNATDISIDKSTGHWIVSGIDTGVAAIGPRGEKGDKGDPGSAGVIDYYDLQNIPNLAKVATTGDYEDLENKPNIQKVPNMVSAFINDANYVSSTNIANNYYSKAQINEIFNILENKMPKDYTKDYLTIESIDDDNEILWSHFESGSPQKIIFVSVDGGVNWTQYTSSALGTVLGTLNRGDKILIKGLNQSYGTSAKFAYFYTTYRVNVYGNIMSLIYGDSFSDKTTLTTNYTFVKLFQQSKIVSAKNLILPALELASSCYRQMFSGCAQLVDAPELPATTLAESCYNSMFYGCSSLQIAPELPALTLQKWSYSQMFQNCSQLNYIKCLATNLGTEGTKNWVVSVAASGTFVKNNLMEDWTVGNDGIPVGWNLYTEYDYDFVRRYELDAKQDVLVSGQNIMTINGNSIIGSGNMTITADNTFAQEQADWNQTDTTAVDYIKNKPTNLTDFTNDLKSFNRFYNWSDVDNLITPGVYLAKYNMYADQAADSTDDQRCVICVESTNSYHAFSNLGDTYFNRIQQFDITRNLHREKTLVSGAPMYSETRSTMVTNPDTNETIETTEVLYNGNWVPQTYYDSMITNMETWTEWESTIPDTSTFVMQSQLALVAITGNWDDLTSKPDLSLKVDRNELAQVAFTGEWADIKHKPPIGTESPGGQNDGNYVTFDDLDEYVTFDDLSEYVTTSDLGDYITASGGGNRIYNEGSDVIYLSIFDGTSYSGRYVYPMLVPGYNLLKYTEYSSLWDKTGEELNYVIFVDNESVDQNETSRKEDLNDMYKIILNAPSGASNPTFNIYIVWKSNFRPSYNVPTPGSIMSDEYCKKITFSFSSNINTNNYYEYSVFLDFIKHQVKSNDNTQWMRGAHLSEGQVVVIPNTYSASLPDVTISGEWEQCLTYTV